jgi:hypothetical protein
MKKNLRLLSVVVAAIAIVSLFTTTLGAGIVIVTTKSNLFIKGVDMSGNCTQHGCHNNSNMTTITGVLIQEGANYKIGTTTLNFGCYNYINTTMSPYDFDGDGTIETILNELLGMIGTSITVQGFLSCHGTKLNVYYINGLLYRNSPC